MGQTESHSVGEAIGKEGQGASITEGETAPRRLHGADGHDTNPDEAGQENVGVKTVSWMPGLSLESLHSLTEVSESLSAALPSLPPLSMQNAQAEVLKRVDVEDVHRAFDGTGGLNTGVAADAAEDESQEEWTRMLNDLEDVAGVGKVPRQEEEQDVFNEQESAVRSAAGCTGEVFDAASGQWVSASTGQFVRLSSQQEEMESSELAEAVRALQHRHDRCCWQLDPHNLGTSHKIQKAADRVRRIKATYGAQSKRAVEKAFAVIGESPEAVSTGRQFVPPGIDPLSMQKWQDASAYTEEEARELESRVLALERVAYLVVKHENIAATLVDGSNHLSQHPSSSSYAFAMQEDCRDLYEEPVDRLRKNTGMGAGLPSSDCLQNAGGKWSGLRAERRRHLFRAMVAEPSDVMPHESLFFRPDASIGAPGCRPGGRFHWLGDPARERNAVLDMHEREEFKAKKTQHECAQQQARIKREQELLRRKTRRGHLQHEYEERCSAAKAVREKQEDIKAASLDPNLQRRRPLPRPTSVFQYNTSTLVCTPEGSRLVMVCLDGVFFLLTLGGPVISLV